MLLFAFQTFRKVDEKYELRRSTSERAAKRRSADVDVGVGIGVHGAQPTAAAADAATFQGPLTGKSKHNHLHHRQQHHRRYFGSGTHPDLLRIGEITPLSTTTTKTTMEAEEEDSLPLVPAKKAFCRTTSCFGEPNVTYYLFNLKAP